MTAKPPAVVPTPRAAALECLRKWRAEPGLTNLDEHVTAAIEADRAQLAAAHAAEVGELRAALEDSRRLAANLAFAYEHDTRPPAAWIETAKKHDPGLAHLPVQEKRPAVPRGHCNRCDRCGWEMRDDRGACRPGDCSMRPMPAERSTCAGCGAPFTAPVQEKRR